MRRKHLLQKAITLLLSILLFILSEFSLITVNAKNATVNAKKKTYEIAVVFDNSGSMYGNQAWCRAKYAMEIFASMLNFESKSPDILKVYPMWEVVTDGSQPNAGGSYNPIEIKSKKDIDKISNLYTVNPSNTPFAPIQEAHDNLVDSKATDKWLIVLTDGEFNQIERKKNVGTISSNDLKNRMLNLADNGIKIQYLGFGEASQLQSDESKNFYAKKSSDTSLKDDLIGICNSIFQRVVLPSKYLNGNNLSLDISMRKIIVFAQGNNAKIQSLKDSSGKSVKILQDSGQRKYSEIRARGYLAAPVDNTLAGQVVTFDATSKGKYTLEYSNADSIQIFYDPDVDIGIDLVNSDGEKIDTSTGEIYAGDYKLNYHIVDNVTGDDVTKSELMGNDVNLKATVKQSNKDSLEVENGGTITLEPDNNTRIVVSGTYLKDYTITSEGTGVIPDPLKIKLPEMSKFEIKSEVLQSGNWYKISDHDNWKPIRINVLLDGQPLSDEQLKQVKFSFDFSDDISYTYDIVSGKSAVDVYIGKTENGKFIQPNTGKYSLKVKATLLDKFNQEMTDNCNAGFEVQKYDKFWRWLIWILIILALIILIISILNRPTLPSAIYMNIHKSSHLLKRNGNMVNLSTDLHPGELRCEAKACTPLKNKGKRIAKFKIKRMAPMGNVLWFEIDGIRFTKEGTKYVNDDGETIETLKNMIVVSDETDVKWKTNTHIANGTVYINHN